MEYHPISTGWQPPAGSPPLPDHARDVIGMMESVYAATSFSPPWTGYMVRRGNEWVSTCAFKTPPQHGRVEIAYFTFPEYEGKGIGTAMAAWLVATALGYDPDVTVFAYTLPEENASTRILGKNGFVSLGDVQHPEDGLVREWEYRGAGGGGVWA